MSENELNGILSKNRYCHKFIYHIVMMKLCPDSP